MEGCKGKMKNAAIYCRVSGDGQERDGTSLQTQHTACLTYCQEMGHGTPRCFSEVGSRLTLERPKLNELRELVRNEQIDVVVVYCLDRFSGDPTHGVILQEELEKHGVALEAVIEKVDDSDLGKMISYIRTYSAKLEVEKILERTMRGKKAKARMGRMSGGFHNTYGYDYIKTSQENGGRRVINETEAKWVKLIYDWLVSEGLSSSAITHRLRALKAPTKRSQYWNRTSVLAILRNPAYMGKTYAFTTVKGRKCLKPQNEWIEIAGATPPIISKEMFDAAQKQLQLNRAKAQRNTKREYLLRGHLYCRRCGRSYWGYGDRTKQRYRCPRTQRLVAPVNRCNNKSWSADIIEASVWTQIQRILDNPELIVAEIEKQRDDASNIDILEAELQRVEKQMKVLDRDQKQLLQWALKGFPEETVVAENKRINEKRRSLQSQKAELEMQIKVSREAAVNLPKLEVYIQLIRNKLATLDFDMKRLALDMLNIKVWIDGQSVEITGTIPVEDADVVTRHSSEYQPARNRARCASAPSTGSVRQPG